MKQISTRLFVFPKDIQLITGKGERYSRTCYKKMKEHYRKEPHHYITIEEMANYYGLKKEDLETRLR